MANDSLAVVNHRVRVLLRTIAGVTRTTRGWLKWTVLFFDPINKLKCLWFTRNWWSWDCTTGCRKWKRVQFCCCGGSGGCWWCGCCWMSMHVMLLLRLMVIVVDVLFVLTEKIFILVAFWRRHPKTCSYRQLSRWPFGWLLVEATGEKLASSSQMSELCT